MKTITAVLFLILGVSIYSCSTTCGCSVPAKDAQGKATVIQYPEK